MHKPGPVVRNQWCKFTNMSSLSAGLKEQLTWLYNPHWDPGNDDVKICRYSKQSRRFLFSRFNQLNCLKLSCLHFHFRVVWVTLGTLLWVFWIFIKGSFVLFEKKSIAGGNRIIRHFIATIGRRDRGKAIFPISVFFGENPTTIIPLYIFQSALDKNVHCCKKVWFPW